MPPFHGADHNPCGTAADGCWRLLDFLCWTSSVVRERPADLRLLPVVFQHCVFAVKTLGIRDDAAAWYRRIAIGIHESSDIATLW